MHYHLRLKYIPDRIHRRHFKNFIKAIYKLACIFSLEKRKAGKLFLRDLLYMTCMNKTAITEVMLLEQIKFFLCPRDTHF